MFKKSAVWAAALFMALGATTANAADVAPAAPSWSGFYGGLYVGVTHGLETSLKTSADAQEQRSVGWCQNTASGNRFKNKDSLAACEGVDEIEWRSASKSCDPGFTITGSGANEVCTPFVSANPNICPSGFTQGTGGNSSLCVATASSGSPPCGTGFVNVSGSCRATTPIWCNAGYTWNGSICVSNTAGTNPPTTTAAGCYVDGVLDESINQGQCRRQANDNGPPTKWLDNSDFSFLQDLTTAQSVISDETNFTAGVIGGYNVQRGRVVFGLEADMGKANEMHEMESSAFSSVDADDAALDYIDSVNDGTCADCFVINPGTGVVSPAGPLPEGQELDGAEFGLIENSPTSILTSANADMGLTGFGTIRGRLGGTFHDDRLMAFVTGGLAFGKISTKGSVTYSGTLDDGDASTDDAFSETHNFGDESWELGWTAGAGVNYLIGERAVLGLTYLYTDLGTHKVKDSFSRTADGSEANWFGADDFSSVSGSVEAEVDARFHSLRASFTILFN